MSRVLLVAVGGAIGTVARYLLSGAVQRSFFPTGTLAVNILGCLVIGFVGGLAARPAGLSQTTRIFLATGICGGFTTFSAFGFETMQLIGDGQIWQAGLNIGLQLVGGLGAVWLGLVGSRLM
jgi:CrcB protein